MKLTFAGPMENPKKECKKTSVYSEHAGLCCWEGKAVLFHDLKEVAAHIAFGAVDGGLAPHIAHFRHLNFGAHGIRLDDGGAQTGALRKFTMPLPLGFTSLAVKGACGRVEVAPEEEPTTEMNFFIM